MDRLIDAYQAVAYWWLCHVSERHPPDLRCTFCDGTTFTMKHLILAQRGRGFTQIKQQTMAAYCETCLGQNDIAGMYIKSKGKNR